MTNATIDTSRPVTSLLPPWSLVMPTYSLVTYWSSRPTPERSPSNLNSPSHSLSNPDATSFTILRASAKYSLSTYAPTFCQLGCHIKEEKRQRTMMVAERYVLALRTE